MLWYRMWILRVLCGTPFCMTVDARGTRMVHQNVRLAVDLVEELKALAAVHGVSFSDQVRATLNDGLECPRCKDVPAWKLKAKVQDHDLPAPVVAPVPVAAGGLDDDPWAHYREDPC